MEDKTKKQIVFKRRYWLYALVLVFIAAFYGSFSFQEVVYGFIDFLAEFLEAHKYLGVVVFVLLSAVSAIVSPLSSAPIIPSAMAAWGEITTLFFLLFGWVTGGAIGWTIGYFAGKKILRKHFSFDKIEYYKKRLSVETQFWLVLIFRLAIPSEVAGITLGILKYSFGKYLFVTFITELPFALLAVYSGAALASGEIFVFAGLIAITIIFISVMSLFLKRRI